MNINIRIFKQNFSNTNKLVGQVESQMPKTVIDPKEQTRENREYLFLVRNPDDDIN